MIYPLQTRLRAHRMFLDGADSPEIARILDVNVSTVRNWKRAGVCVECGRPLSQDGVARCAPCASTAKAYWTSERLIERIGAFVERYGRPPRAIDWNPRMALGLGHPELAARFYEDACWPSVTTCQGRFGSLNRAIELAGFESRPSGHRIGMRPWPRAAIVEAIHEWVRLHGETPTNRGWVQAADEHPSSSQVARVFGSWNAAIAAAGFATRAPGGRAVAA